MATKTTNYNLIKPALADDADIRVINGNMDVLDNQLKSISDKAGNATNNAYTNLTVSSDYIWKFTKGSGVNASYDTIKKATTAAALSATTSTYKPNTNASKYTQLEYWFGTQPYKGSSITNIDGGMLKFNHWGATNWNSAIIFGNNSSNRPYMAYQNGTAGDYSVFKELAWYDDTTNKLPLTGGNMTGPIKTTDNIYKTSNNGSLVLSGSTDASHGGRINLSGEKQTNAGAVKITADNGTASNVFEVNANGQYTFNGLPIRTNSVDDYFRFGDDNAYFRMSKNKTLFSNAGTYDFNGLPIQMNSNDDYFRFGDDAYLRLGKNKGLVSNAVTCTFNGVPHYYNKGKDLLKIGDGTDTWFAINKAEDKLYYSPKDTTLVYEVPYTSTPLTFSGTQSRGNDREGYIKFSNGLLIQWGCVTTGRADVANKPHNLPLPYANTGYLSYLTLGSIDGRDIVAELYRSFIYNKSESVIGIWNGTGTESHWMTIGQGA